MPKMQNYNYMRKYPFVLLLTALVAGILLADLFHGFIWAALTVAAALATGALLLVFSSSPKAALRLGRWHVVWVALFFIGLGMLVENLNSPSNIDFDNDLVPEIAVADVREVVPMTYGDRIVADLVSLQTADGSRSMPVHNTKVLLNIDVSSAVPGDRVCFVHAFRKIEDNPANPVSGHSVQQLLRKNILYRQNLKEHEVIVEKGGGGISAMSIAWAIRERVEVYMDKSSLDDGCRRLLQACLLGDSRILLPQERQEFSDAGIAHILALSGLHITIVAALILWLLAPLSLKYHNSVKYFVAIVLMWLYAWFTGMPLSVVRAAVMTTFVFLAIGLERQNSAVNSLFAALFFILMFDPSAIYDVGLQLSFVTVFSLVVFGNRLGLIDRSRHPHLYKIESIALTSIIALGGSWVLMAYYFETFPLLFLPVNMLVLPLLPLFMVGGVFYVLLLTCGFDFHLLGASLSMYADALAGVASKASAWGSGIHLGITEWTVLLWMMALGATVAALALKRRLWGYTAGTLAVFAVASIWLFPRTYPYGFLVESDPHKVSLQVYRSHEPGCICFEEYAESAAEIMDNRVICLDAQPAATGLRRHCDVLILGRHFRGSVSDLLAAYEPQLIVASAGVYSSKDESLCQEAQAAGIRFHSVRNDGALWIPGENK